MAWAGLYQHFPSAVIPEAAAGGCPESISTARGYGFRARAFGAPRNDGRMNIALLIPWQRHRLAALDREIGREINVHDQPRLFRLDHHRLVARDRVDEMQGL